MTMGLPSEGNQATPSSLAATFRWDKQQTFDNVDPSGTPYDLTVSPVTDTTPADVQIPVAVEFSARPAGSLDTNLGEFDSSRAILTILDEHWVQVQGADQVLLGENVYDIQFTGPPIGLFEVTVFQVYCLARDES